MSQQIKNPYDGRTRAGKAWAKQQRERLAEERERKYQASEAAQAAQEAKDWGKQKDKVPKVESPKIDLNPIIEKPQVETPEARVQRKAEKREQENQWWANYYQKKAVRKANEKLASLSMAEPLNIANELNQMTKPDNELEKMAFGNLKDIRQNIINNAKVDKTFGNAFRAVAFTKNFQQAEAKNATFIRDVFFPKLNALNNAYVDGGRTNVELGKAVNEMATNKEALQLMVKYNNREGYNFKLDNDIRVGMRLRELGIVMKDVTPDRTENPNGPILQAMVAIDSKSREYYKAQKFDSYNEALSSFAKDSGSDSRAGKDTLIEATDISTDFAEPMGEAEAYEDMEGAGLVNIMDCITSNDFPDGGCCYQYLKANFPAAYKKAIADKKTREAFLAAKPITDDSVGKDSMTIRELCELFKTYKINYTVLSFDNKVVLKGNFKTNRKHVKHAMFKVLFNHIYPVTKTAVKKKLMTVGDSKNSYVSKYFKTLFDEGETIFSDNLPQQYREDCAEHGIITQFNTYNNEMMSYRYLLNDTIQRVKKTHPEFDLIRGFLQNYDVVFTSENRPHGKNDFSGMQVNCMEDVITKWNIRSVFNDRARDILFTNKTLPFCNSIANLEHREDVALEPDTMLKSIDLNKAYGSALLHGTYYTFDVFSEFKWYEEGMTGHGLYICECLAPLANLEVLDFDSMTAWGDRIVKKLFFMEAPYYFTMPKLNTIVAQIKKEDLDRIHVAGAALMAVAERNKDSKEYGHLYQKQKDLAEKFMRYKAMDCFKYMTCNIVGCLLKKTQNVTKCHVVDAKTMAYYKTMGFYTTKMLINGDKHHVIYERKKKPLFETGIAVGMKVINHIRRRIWRAAELMKSDTCEPLYIKTDAVIYRGEVTSPYILRNIKNMIGCFKAEENPRPPIGIIKEFGLDDTKLKYHMLGMYGKGLYLNGLAGYAKSYTLNQTEGELPMVNINGEVKRLETPKGAPKFFGEIKARCAFTNMSASVIKGVTIHKLLNIRKDKSGHAKISRKRVEGKYLIIDEISQIKPSLWDKIILHVKLHKLKVILSGDPYQINECASRGKDIRVIIEMLCRTDAKLITYRRGEGSPNAAKMLTMYDDLLKKNLDVRDLVPKLPAGKVVRKCICRLNETRKAFNREVMDRWKLEHGKKEEHLVIPAYKGPNTEFEYYSQDCIIFPGTPVIALFSKMTKAETIYKNEEGFIVNLDPITIRYSDGRTTISNNFDGFVVNWATTGAKAQGQTYDYPYMIKDVEDIKKNEKDLAVNFFYTCISRATNISNVYLGD